MVVTWGRRVGLLCIQLLLTCIGMILISALPSLFLGMKIHIPSYIEEIRFLCNKLLHFSDLTYVTKNISRPLFPQILLQYKQTVVILLLALCIASFVSFLLTVIILRLPHSISRKIVALFIFLESLPDILIIISFQFIVVWTFQQTNIMIFQIASIGETKSIFLPVVCLSIPVTFLFVKILLQLIREEIEKEYVKYAKAKGFGEMYILFHHILRNIFFHLMAYGKTIVWFMLSNLILIEYVFNVNGLLSFLLQYPTSEVFFVGFFLLYIPFLILFTFYKWFVPTVMMEGK